MKPIIYSSLLFLLMLSSCINDDKLAVKTSTGEEANVTVTVRVPAQTSGITTYAMDNASENELKTIDVLVFEKGNDGKEYFRYKATASSIDNNNGANEKKFNVTLIKKSYAQRLVIIANSHDQLEALGTIEQTGVKEEVLKRLIYRNENEWNSTSSTNFTPFPMWGESDFVTINDATTSIPTIKILRMIARIDVQIMPDAEGDFKLKTVSLFNRKTRGHVVANTESGNWDHTTRKALKATLPANDEPGSPLTILGPLTYKDATTPDSAFIQTIYTFEATAPPPTEASKATCLVVGGYFEKDNDLSYYRLDFVNKDEQDNITGYKDVLRNHLYKVNIIEISGRGYDNEEDAFNSKPMNMECEVREWDQGDFGEIVFDGQYLLAVDPGEFRLTREERDGNTIKIFTDVPTGWKATPDPDCDWLTLSSSDNGPADTDCTLIFKVDPNNTGAERETYIKITAGRLSYIVKIIQTMEDEIFLTVTENGAEVTELIFSADPTLTYAPMEHTIQVSWVPTIVSCPISAFHVLEQFVHAGLDPAQQPPLAGGGPEDILIEADPMSANDIKNDPFLTRLSYLEFTVNHNSVQLRKTIFLRQTNYTVIPQGVEDSYLMDGSEYSFIVRSNANWTAKIVKEGAQNDDEKNIIVPGSFPSSGTANETGTEFKFKMINDENGNADGGIAYITFSSPEGKFHDVRVKLVGESPVGADVTNVLANCYMIKPGGNGISFPVKQANADGTTRLQSGTVFELELLWSDHTNFLGANAPVASYKKTGDGSEARIIVNPGSVPGNSLIALKVNGVIKWSWHIWTVDYDPNVTYKTNNGYTIMDRNLGAISAERTSSRNLGLMYEWGRKDPFPGAAGKGQNTFFPIYKAANTQKTVEVKVASVANNIENAIANPVTYYLGTSGNTQNWATNGDTYNDTYWGKNAAKTAYDPCPAGWRLPLSGEKSPLYNDWSGSWDNSNLGRNFTAAGYYPATGRITPNLNSTTITLQEVGTTGFYWTTSTNGGNQAQGYSVNSGTGDHSSNNHRDYGRAVRCVKDGYSY